MPGTDRSPVKRRAEDLKEDVDRWAYIIALHRGKLIALAVTLASFATWIVTTAGYRYVGPPQDVARVERKVDSGFAAITVRVTRFEESAANRDVELRSLRNQLQFVIYLQCTQMRSGDKYATQTCAQNRDGIR